MKGSGRCFDDFCFVSGPGGTLIYDQHPLGYLGAMKVYRRRDMDQISFVP